MKKTFIFVLVIFLITQLLFAAEKQKIIFDCDLGGDIDDAFALALVLCSPEFEVLGVALDHGNTPKRAQVACRLLYECGLEQIPVVVGRPTPGIVGEQTELAGDSHQFAWAEGFEKVTAIKQNAADFIIENLRKYPHEIILFTVGPVPNIRDIIEKDPHALKLAKRVVSMFGSFYMGYATGSKPEPEWNVRADIGAARQLVNAGVNPLLAGLDVTTFVKLNEENRLRLLYRNSPLTDALCGLYTLWRYEDYAYPNCTMYDGVAVGMVLWPELFTTKKVHVTVDDRGATLIDETKTSNCEIGVTIDAEKFIQRMLLRLLKQNFMRK
ncbi:nucleoside hydrolase [candidate division KSB1 bacterium]|nr:nucleoside hydrolase [candidate division KSB1 bacterium]